MVANRPIEQVVLSAIRGGATLIQYREKNACMRDKYERAAALCPTVKQHGVPFIVNDRADLALAVDADGVHLGQDDLPAAVARRILGEGSILGVSVGSVAEALQAQQDGADYVSIGPIFPTLTKRDAGDAVSPQLATEIVKTVDLPVMAIGGIDAANASEVMQLGVDGVAVVSAVMTAEDPMLAAREILDKVDSSRSNGAFAGQMEMM
jgi:thiamine-phosphate pyrophosphorylase